MKKVLPSIMTKKFFFEIYYTAAPKKTTRNRLNFMIKSLGGNVRKRNLTEAIIILYVNEYYLPEHYILSDEMQKKLNRIKKKLV